MAGAMNKIARRRGADLKWQATGGANRVLHHLGNAIKMGKADRQLGGRVDHGDLRLFHIGVAEAEGAPLRAAHGPERRAALEITAKLFAHHARFFFLTSTMPLSASTFTQSPVS